MNGDKITIKRIPANARYIFEVRPKGTTTFGWDVIAEIRSKGLAEIIYANFSEWYGDGSEVRVVYKGKVISKSNGGLK